MPAGPKDSRMTHPLIDRLETELGWPRLRDRAAVEAFIAAPGPHCLFVPGDPARNLETADAAVILPELRAAFQNAFDCAIVDDAIENAIRQEYRALKTPGFLFFRAGAFLGDIQKIRDWDDYLARTAQLLSLAEA
jgi:hydrogenase-1 operon protein HyaE